MSSFIAKVINGESADKITPLIWSQVIFLMSFPGSFNVASGGLSLV